MPKAKRKTVPADDGGEIVWRSQVVHPRPALASGALLLIAIEPTVAQRAASNAQAATRRARRTARSRWSSPGGPPETSPRGSHEASLFSSTSVRRTAQSEPGVLRSPGGPVQVVQSRWSTRDQPLHLPLCCCSRSNPQSPSGRHPTHRQPRASHAIEPSPGGPCCGAAARACTCPQRTRVSDSLRIGSFEEATSVAGRRGG
jgi:hypothetical protein